jgi:predicted aconitase with swiveling domain
VIERAARSYTTGNAEGPALVLREPLSFWGGIDPLTGRVIDRSHPDAGACVTGTVLVMPGGRGSSSAASVLAESVRLGTGPAAIVLAVPDPILTVGAIVAESLYACQCPIVTCSVDGISTGDQVTVKASGDGATVSVADH